MTDTPTTDEVCQNYVDGLFLNLGMDCERHERIEAFYRWLAYNDAAVLRAEASRLTDLVSGYQHESPQLRAGSEIILQIKEQARKIENEEETS